MRRARRDLLTDQVADHSRVDLPGDNSGASGHPILYSFARALDFFDPDLDQVHIDDDEHFESCRVVGGYPRGFLERAFAILGVDDPRRVLHLCSGSVTSGIRIDIRHAMRPSVVADCRVTPFRDESFDWIIADPPYSPEWAANLYGTEESYPRPLQIMREAARLLRPGGRVGLLHFQVPMFRKPLRLVSVHGITTGLGYAIRAFTVLEKIGALAADDLDFGDDG